MGTPVKVPAAASNYTTATQDSDLRSQINACLLQSGNATRIQEHLLHALHAHASNWPTIVQSHALSLLRSGEVATFPALVQHVLDDIKREAQASRNTSGSLSTSVNSKIASANGISNTNGSIMSQKNHKLESGASLIIPTRVIEEAIKVTQEHLEGICEMEQT